MPILINPYRFAAGGGGGGFAPDDIASLVSWVESDSGVYSDQDGTTPQSTNGGTVRYWKSLLNDGSDWQRRSTAPNDGPAPTLDTGTTINGIQSIRFTSANAEVMLQLRDFSGDTQGELIMVLKMVADPPASSNDSGLVWFSNNDFSTHYPFTTGDVYDGYGTTVRKATGNPSVTLTNWHIYDAWSATNDWALQLNGSTHFSTATNTPSFQQTPFLGRSLGFTEKMNGWLAAVYCFNAKLSSGDRTSMLTYINGKYGL